MIEKSSPHPGNLLQCRCWRICYSAKTYSRKANRQTSTLAEMSSPTPYALGEHAQQTQ